MIVVAIAGLLVLDGVLEIRRDRDTVMQDMSSDALLMGRPLRVLLQDAWRDEGMSRALELLAAASGGEGSISMRWVWLDSTDDPRFLPRVDIDIDPADEDGVSVMGDGPDGVPRLYTYVPVEAEGGERGAIELNESSAIFSARAGRRVKRLVLLLGGVLAIGTLVVVFAGVMLIGRPLDKIQAKARRIASGDLDHPLVLHRRDELSKLATTLNSMCDQLKEARIRVAEETESRIHALEQLRHEDRLRTVGRLASGIAHELGTPLNVVSGRAGLIASGELPEDGVVDSAEIIRSQAERMAQIIRQLLDFARRKPTEKRSVDLYEVVTSVQELLGSLAGKRSIRIEGPVASEADLLVQGNASELQQVVVNLVVNAVQATPDGGAIELSIDTATARRPDGLDAGVECARITVRDRGSGIPSEDLDHVFEPFFTTKDVGQGTGLGLSIVYGIVREHGGWIDVQSTLGEGSCFVVHLPKKR